MIPYLVERESKRVVIRIKELKLVLHELLFSVLMVVVLQTLDVILLLGLSQYSQEILLRKLFQRKKEPLVIIEQNSLNSLPIEQMNEIITGTIKIQMNKLSSIQQLEKNTS